MSRPWLLLASASGLGALWGRPGLAAGLAGLAGLVLVGRRWAAVAAVVAALAGLGASTAWAGLDRPLPEIVEGEARLVGDPADQQGAIRVQVVVGGRHYDAWARGEPAAVLRPLLAGERVNLTGRARELRGRSAPHLRRKHIAARLEVQSAAVAGRGGPADRLGNGLRRIVESGAAHLPDTTRGLFGGLVLGDDRGQPDEVVERFRQAGLSHLLVVSGQNVAFVLALASPLVARGSMGARLAWTAAVLGLFGAMVRWEPSVLRAVVMAGLAAGARSLGGAAQPVPLLCGAVCLLLLADPLLVGSVSFQLSVAASAGLAVLTPRIASFLRGPRLVRELLATTAGAQAGVAPVLLAVFGLVPLVALPANLAAAPAAGPAMAWGMAAGVPAGLAGGVVARAAHLPTQALIWWIDSVATWSSAGGLPPLRPPGRKAVAPYGTRLESAGGATVVVVDDPRPGLGRSLRAAGVVHLDLLIQTGSTPRHDRSTAEVTAELAVRAVVVPPASSFRSAVTRVVDRPCEAGAGPVRVILEPRGEKLMAQLSVASPS